MRTYPARNDLPIVHQQTGSSTGFARSQNQSLQHPSPVRASHAIRNMAALQILQEDNFPEQRQAGSPNIAINQPTQRTNRLLQHNNTGNLTMIWSNSVNNVSNRPTQQPVQKMNNQPLQENRNPLDTIWSSTANGQPHPQGSRHLGVALPSASVHTGGPNIGHPAPHILNSALLPLMSRHITVPGAMAPSTMAMLGPGYRPPPTAAGRAMQRMSNMPSTYLGNPNILHHHSIDGMAEENNCAFWLTNFPPDVLHQEVFDRIRDCGRIHEMVVNNKEADGIRKGAAAKVVFFDREGARRFFWKYVCPVEEGGIGAQIWVRGWRARCKRNRHKIMHREHISREKTRVVRITGPRDEITYDRLTLYFSLFCHYDLEDAIMFFHPRETNIADIEFRFARFDAQSQPVFLAMAHDPFWKNMDPPVTVRYVPDPCDSFQRVRL